MAAEETANSGGLAALTMALRYGEEQWKEMEAELG